MQQLLFIVFSAIAALTAIRVIRSQNVIHAVLWLVVVFFASACLFVLLNAEFIAAMQVLVYAGAIIILYVFSVMLVNLKISMQEAKFHQQKGLSLALGAVIFVELGIILSTKVKSLAVNQGIASSIQQAGGNAKTAGQAAFAKAPLFAGNAQQFGGGTKALGQILYTEYALPFEIVSIILLVAIIGAVVLVIKKPQRQE